MNIQVGLWMSSWALCLLISNGLVCRASEYFVKPTDPADSVCPGEPCYTLNAYASGTGGIQFRSNATVLVLSGTHTLNRSIDINSVNNFTLVGVDSPVITCENRSEAIGLSFINISVLTIKNIDFANCLGSLAQGLPITMEALHFENIINLTVANVRVQNCSEMGFGLTNIVGYSDISSAIFSSNFEGHISIGYSGGNESHIAIRNSEFEFGMNPLSLVIEQSKYNIELDITNITTRDCATKDGDIAILVMETISSSSVDLNIKDSQMSFSAGAAIYVTLPYGTTKYPSGSSTIAIRVINCSIVGNQQGGMFVNVREPVSNAIQPYMLFIGIRDTLVAHNGMFPISLGSAIAVIFPGDLYSANVIGQIDFDHVTFAHTMALVQQTGGYSTTEYMATVFLAYAQIVHFSNCEFVNSTVTAMCAFHSIIHVHQSVSFANNTAYKGAAMAFYGNSSLFVHRNTHLQFFNNRAKSVGGAIYVDRKLPTALLPKLHTPHCFLWFVDAETFKHVSYSGVSFTFSNNAAQNGGDAIYGGLSDTCLVAPMDKSDEESRYWNVETILRTISSFEPSTSVFSSDPLHVCLCENGKLVPKVLQATETRYPGETFTISAVVVGQMFGTVSGSVYAQFLVHNSDKDVPQLGELEQVQQTGVTECSELSYTVLSSNRAVVLALTPTSATVVTYPDNDVINKTIRDYEYDEKSQILLSLPVYVRVTLRPCPLGFILSDYPAQCVCNFQLLTNNFTCNISDQTVLRKGTVWINSSSTGHGVIIYYNCPFGYCKQREIGVNLESPDSQCAMNRSGILCGRCRSGLSLALGTSQCLSCSNEKLAILILFATAGIKLVVFLKLLSLTVSEGTINGIVFYANIVGANQAILFPSGRTNILTVFIAWINLDFGIQTCFFSGLNAYWKTWFQFIFPLYIWIITALIIVLSHYYTSVARLFGRNSVPVLATLVLLSYAKLLRTIITAFSFAVLKLPNGSKTVVWLLDGNIAFFGSSHTPLFLISLSFLLLFWLPYTVILIFVQYLQKHTNLKAVRWIIKLKPFFDAHFGHLKDKHRYWVGALLLVRGILFLIFAANPTNTPNVNLLVIAIFSILLLTYTGSVGQVYKRWYLSLLENSFLINLALLSTASLYVQPSVSGQESLTNSAVSIAFIQFVGVVIFHAWKLIKDIKCWRALKMKPRQPARVEHPENSDGLEYRSLDNNNIQAIQPVNLRIRFNDLGEPTLEYH